MRDLPAPPQVVVPLVQPDGGQMRPVVEPGQQVTAGDPIGRCEGESPAVIHASISGLVKKLSRVDTVFGKDLPAVEIEAAQPQSEPADAAPPQRDPPAAAPHTDLLVHASRLKPAPAELAECADRCGIIDIGRSVAALGAVLREASVLRPRHIIINGLQPEPMLTAGTRVLRDQLAPILGAGIVIRNALGIKRIWLAIDAADRDLVKQCRPAVLGTPIRIAALPNKYPQAVAPLLAWTLTGRETPYGRQPIHAGVLVVNAATLADLWVGLQHSAPVISRVVAVDGPAVVRPNYFRVPLGTSYRDVIAHAGLRHAPVRVIDGGPMTGRSVESLDAVVTQATTAILLIDHDNDNIPEPGACIRCGQCQEHCPAGLDPLRLLDAAERERPGEAAGLFPLACMECGLCSYMCPAELPLAEAAARLKRDAAHAGS